MTMILEDMKNQEVITFIQSLIRDEVAKLYYDELPEKRSGLAISVRKGEFDELKDIVRLLASDQRETKKELRELADAQKRTEIKVEELADAQKRTEIKVEELADAQKRTEIKIAELAEAQKKTETGLQTLTVTVKDMQKQLGGLSMDVGYGIEDKIIPYIADFGKKEFGIDVGLVERKNIVYPDGRYDEINIYAEGLKNGIKSYIIGECKAQPGKKDFDRLSKVAERVKKILEGDIYTFVAGYIFSPDTEAYAKNQYPDIKFFKTYEFELKFEKIRIF